MNRKVLVIVITLLLLVTAGWYFLSSRSGTPPLIQTPDNTTQPSAVTNLKDLINKGLAQTCTFTTDNSKGTVYTKGGKVRQDFEISDKEQTMKSHMIVMNNTVYSWSDGDKTGFKMTYDPSQTPPPAMESPNAGPSGSFDTNASMDYKCSSWLVDASKFDLPAGVTFSTFDMPSQVPSKESSSSSPSQCSYCDSLTGTDKPQCLSALKCK